MNSTFTSIRARWAIQVLADVSRLLAIRTFRGRGLANARDVVLRRIALSILAFGIQGNFTSLNGAQTRFDRPIFVVVPREYATNKSSAGSKLPFSNYGPEPFLLRQPTRYQQVYAASDFGTVPAGGGFITELEFRGACESLNNLIFSKTLPFVIWMSTTTKSPDRLSARFSDNVGAAKLLTVTNQDIFIQASHGPCDSPESRNDTAWTTRIPLGTPFFYDPSAGNLLIEMQIPLGKLGDPNYLRMINEVSIQTNDAISRVAAAGMGTEIADTVDTGGLVTKFTFFDFPKLTISQSNGLVTVSWPSNPTPMQLQFTDSLVSKTEWKSFGSPSFDTLVTRGVKIPLTDLKRPRYFRLFWNSPQPGIVQP